MANVVIKVTSLNIDPFSFHHLQGRRAYWQVVSGSQTWYPPTDVIETAEGIIIQVEIAGMKDGEIKITLDEQFLLISGNRPNKKEKCAYHQLEIGYGSFQTGIKLSSPVDIEKIEAVYEDGFLEVLLPKLTPRQIDIKD